MRVFTGIPLGDDVCRNVLQELKPFREAAASMRWTAAQNIHLTLKFIGEVEQGLAGRIAAALAAMPAAPFFRLRLRGFGAFSAAGELRVFWAGVEESPALGTLFAAVEEALAPLGIVRDKRPFRPHVTLGRSRGRGKAARISALLQQRSGLFLGEWLVSSFRLFASRLTPSGPVYSVLQEIPLVQQ